MQMVKQEPSSKQCGLCVVAMLTDRTREQIQADVPDYEAKADWFWLNYIRALGYVLEDVRNDPGFDRSLTCEGKVFSGHFKLPLGHQYYCTVCTPTAAHAIAIDQHGMVFDPSNSAPMTGACTLEEHVRCNHQNFGEATIGCCYRVQK